MSTTAKDLQWSDLLPTDAEFKRQQLQKREQEQALALHAALDKLKFDLVPIVCRERGIARIEQAQLARQLFKRLGLKGISVTCPNYSMAQSVDVRLPKRSDYVFDVRGMVDHLNDKASQANSKAQRLIDAILLKAFPFHDNRSDSQSDYFDYCWSVS